MKIVIIADSMDDQYAGVFTYSKNLILTLLREDQQNEYIFVHSKKNDFFRNTKEMIVKDFRYIPFYGTFRKFFILPWIFKKLHPDIVHDLSHMGPFLWSGSYKKVITVHDCTPLLFPHLHPARSVWGHRLFWKTILRHCDHLIAVSPDTKNDLITLFPFTKQKITVIPLAAEETREEGAETQMQQIQKMSPYILFIGTLEPRKNIPLLVEAFEKLHSRYQIPHNLVLAGKWGWKSRSIRRKIQKSPLQHKIMHLAYVSPAVRTMLYRQADVFVYPSLYEGFGLSLLEAMQAHCPVIAANVPGVRTTVQAGGVLFESNSVEELTHALYTVLGDKTLRQKMIVAGETVVKNYSWQKTAHKTISLYQNL
jgi:glycosyltransferase involved in cell wall biosynthesis